jgi:hypothetical protein
VNLNESIYNPLANIFKIFDKQAAFVTADLQGINNELFLGGVVLQNDDELSTVIDLLVECYRNYNGN